MAMVLAIGADLCYSTRAMMLALGCIQALQCNGNICPIGGATQDKSLMTGLDLEDKTERVKNYHHETIHSLIELIAAVGIKKPSDLKRAHINRRTSQSAVLQYNEIYKDVKVGSYL
ncbi:MAG: glutamate synthase domain-containing protein 2 [Glaciecola sp.]|jgi:glutamate synthase domain-containing protein 2